MKKIIKIFRMIEKFLFLERNFNKMDNKYLVSETTKEERKDIVKKALGISLLGANMPSDEVLNLAKQYIDGKIEIEEIQNKVLEKYTNGGNLK